MFCIVCAIRVSRFVVMLQTRSSTCVGVLETVALIVWFAMASALTATATDNLLHCELWWGLKPCCSKGTRINKCMIPACTLDQRILKVPEPSA